MRLRPGTAEDAAAISALERELFAADAWSSRLVGEELTGAGRRVLVAEDAVEVVGYAVTAIAGDVADLLRVGVAPAHRRRGIGGRLLGEALAHAVSDGADRMLLEVAAGNAPALACYAAAGFFEISRRPRYYRDGSDALVLCRELGRSTDPE